MRSPAAAVARAAARRLPDAALVALVARSHRRFEPELRHLRTYLSTGRRTALDVGAWYGPWTFALTEHFAQVVAIEPNPQVAARLAPSLPRIATLVRAAASDRRGEATLYAPAAVGAEGVGSLHSVGVGLRAHIVQMLPIDELGLDDVDFIKLDVEGHELPALRGASATIERCRPTIIAELEERLAPTAPVFRYLADLGYRPHLLNGTKLEGVDPGNFATHTCLPTSYLSAVLRPGAHHRQNNVIFLPR